MVFVFLQIRCKFSDGVQFTVSASVRRETGSARQNNSVKSGTEILPSCEQTRTHCRWFERRKVSCHKYNRWTKIISNTLSSVTRFLKLYRSCLLQDGKSKLILPSPPPNNVVSHHLQQQTSQHRSGEGEWGMVQIVCICELAIWRQCLRWTIFWSLAFRRHVRMSSSQP